MTPPAAAGGSSESRQPSPAVQPGPGSVPAEAPATPRAQAAPHVAARSPAAAPAPAPRTVVRGSPRSGRRRGTRVRARLPGRASPRESRLPVQSGLQAGGGSTMRFGGSRGLGSGGRRPERRGVDGGRARRVGATHSGGLASGGGPRPCGSACSALGALWPLWRRERRKGAGELSVRPLGTMLRQSRAGDTLHRLISCSGPLPSLSRGRSSPGEVTI